MRPPTGRVQHSHGLPGTYFPVELLYARTSMPERSTKDKLDELLEGTRARREAVARRTQREAAEDAARAAAAVAEAEAAHAAAQAAAQAEAAEQQAIAAAHVPITCPACEVAGAMRCVAADAHGKRRQCERGPYRDSLAYGNSRCRTVIEPGRAHFQCDCESPPMCLCLACGHAAMEAEAEDMQHE